VAGLPIRLVFASPTQLNGLMPDGLTEGDTNVEVSSRDRPQHAVRPVAIVTSAPGCVAITQDGRTLTIWATGLGKASLSAEVGGTAAAVLYAGPSAAWDGLDQINVAIPEEVPVGEHLVSVSLLGSAPFCSRSVPLK
ncbi:MAG TPA: hypothetical protein VES20_08460, partial [Bryobacteraceae bacterium]|nr:hypothetical protein [Bryobacteraceae bacterium]